MNKKPLFKKIIMKNIKILFALLLGISSLSLNAQVAVSTDGSSADASAMLDVKSTTKGVLITRMSQTQRNAISSPATGLMIYQTDNTPGFYYYNGSGWTQLGAGADLSAYALQNNVLELDNVSSYTPTANYHPATKLYVDNSVPSLTNYALKTEVLTKSNTTTFTPTSSYHPATKTYVDGKASQWTTYGEGIYYSTGNVGIGTIAAADAELLIKRGGKIGWNYGTSGNTCHTWISKEFTGPMIFDNSYGGQTSDYDHYDFRIGGGSVLTIQGDKYVGIGTDSPSAELEIAGNNTDPPTIELQGNGSQRSVLGEINFRNEYWGVNNDKLRASIKGVVHKSSGYTGELAFFTSSSNVEPTERMRIDRYGKVGIGVDLYNTDLSHQLQVNGTVAGIGAYYNWSDKRFKKDIMPLDGALKTVLSLQGVTFNWNKAVDKEINFDDRNHIGFLAQDLEEVLPQVVFTADDEMKTKSVAYGDVVPVLVEAIKEQQDIIEKQQKQIDMLQQNLEDLINSLSK